VNHVIKRGGKAMKRQQRKLLVVAATTAMIWAGAIPAAAVPIAVDHRPVIESCRGDWPAPSDARERAASAMLPMDPNAVTGYDAAASLQIVAGGVKRVVPAGIGVDRLTSWVSPLSTQACDGVIHIEAPKRTHVYLWQLFGEWGVRLTQYCIGEYCNPGGVAIVLNGKGVAMCPGAIGLDAGTRIELEV
jgi:hypothetical protein